MARVLIFANHHGTLYNFRRELLTRLVANGDAVTVALPSHQRNTVFSDLGCTVHELGLSRFGTNPVRELLTLSQFISTTRRVRPNVVLTYTAKPNVYGGIAAQLCRVPYVSTITGLGTVFQSGGTLMRLSAALQRFALRKSTRVFFQNASNMAHFSRLGIGEVSGMLLPGSGVNLALHELEPYREGSGLCRFIVVSRIRRDKGFDELFEAIRAVSGVMNDVEFVIVGGFEDPSYEEQADQLKTLPVRFCGEVPQERVHQLIAESQALVHPSHHEGMANVILEAAAAGLPCIVSDIPGCREAIEEGVTGFLFEMGSSADLVNALTRFLSLTLDARREMGLRGRTKMEREFDREQVVDRYLEAIAECISGREGGE